MEQYLEKLRRCPFFEGICDRDILAVLGCVNGRVIKAVRGRYVMHVGDTTTSMGLVLTGSLLIVQEDLWGHRNIMSRCSEGSFFAEPYAATPGSVLNISVVADEDCEILLIDVGRLLSTCSNACDFHQRLIRNLVSVLAGRILVFNDKVTHMSKRTTREKLLSYLSAESLRQGSLSFDIPYDRQQLADFLCVERSAMSAELSRLQKQGILKTQKNHFELYTTREPV